MPVAASSAGTDLTDALRGSIIFHVCSGATIF
jgi:hypothetical protein